jgi:hypothetical protein
MVDVEDDVLQEYAQYQVFASFSISLLLTAGAC